jgi:hypothetical protein
MLKRVFIVAAAVAALAAIAVPTASAAIQDKGVPIELNQTETYTGTFEFQSAELGKVHCTQAEMQGEMLAGQLNVTIKLLQIKLPTLNCTVSGALGAICGASSAHSVSLVLHAQLRFVFGWPPIRVRNVRLSWMFGSTGSPCVELELFSTETREITITPDNESAISTTTLGGTLETAFGPVNIGGTLHAHNPGTYGFQV